MQKKERIEEDYILRINSHSRSENSVMHTLTRNQPSVLNEFKIQEMYSNKRSLCSLGVRKGKVPYGSAGRYMGTSDCACPAPSPSAASQIQTPMLPTTVGRLQIDKIDLRLNLGFDSKPRKLS